MNRRRLLAAALAGGWVALALSAPAGAHGGDAPAGTNYRSQVTGVTPALPGVTVRTVEAGARLELTNRAGQTVEILGYDGEPYLEVRPDGVYQNDHSPATYLNATLAGDTEPPPEADPTAAPLWRRVSGDTVVRWHDRRVNWISGGVPPEVSADPARVHRVREWTVPLRVQLTTAEIRGTLDWIPPPNAVLWWAAVVVGAAGIGALGLLPLGAGWAGRWRRPATADDPAVGGAEDPAGSGGSPVTESGGALLSGTAVAAGSGRPAGSAGVAVPVDPAEPAEDVRDSGPDSDGPARAAGTARLIGGALGLLAILGGVAAIVYAVARELDSGADGLGGVLLGLLATQVWPMLTALGAIAAGAYALANRSAADFALALAGICLALFVGATNAAVLMRSVAPVPWPAAIARVLVALVIAVGVGQAAANGLRMRAAFRADQRLSRRPQPADQAGGTAPGRASAS